MSLNNAQGKTLSDTWHRVARLSVSLRPTVIAHRQVFQGQSWVILRDRLSSDWYRVTPDAFHFLSRLDGVRTVEEIWNEALEADTERCLSQEEVVQLLGQLNLSNLLFAGATGSSASFFERFTKRKARERQALWMGILSIKLPLWDPDVALTRALPLIRFLFGRMGLLVYAVLLVLGLKAAVDGWDELFDQSAGLLAPSNLPLLYLGFLLSKTVHELSHAALCKRLGGEVHTLGVMLLVFAPMPYVDASTAWGFRSRLERVAVGFAGVAAELAVAAVAVLVWSNTAPGTLNALAYNVIFVASVSTVVFNLNPLLRFDGYHMLVDLLGLPNLFQRSRDQLKYLGQRFVLGIPHAQPAARTPSELWILPTYGVMSIVYWLLLMSTIVFFIAEEYLDLGVALALLLVVVTFVVPAWKFLGYLAKDPSISVHRGQAILRSGAVLGVLAILLLGVPVPDRVRVVGVVQANEAQEITSQTEGMLVEMLVRPGSQVTKGQPLARLENTQLPFELESMQMQLLAVQAQEVRAMASAPAELEAIAQQQRALEEGLAELKRRQNALIIRASATGTWSAPKLSEGLGQWVARGQSLGTITQSGNTRFVAVLPQVASHVLGGSIDRAEVRLRGQEEHNLVADALIVLPFEQGALPSPALGMAGGGLIAVTSDPSGAVAAEPFFRIEGEISEEAARALGVSMVHGRVGTLRLTLESQPLFAQWERDLRQFFQRRFRV